LGFDIKVNVLYRISRDSREEFKNFVMMHENVNSIFKINNGFDFLVEAIFRDLNDYHKFNEQLEKFNIQVKQEMFILEDLKREGFLSDMNKTESLFVEE
ncbi:TPA: Lrp/AsnC family transcriptional regulator, partial [Candidatus Woesearchaeota archaeon]|nr:Lrp/AsnC family transcriptional regulator [Candidatus Woesearchaeota archaeon]